ncbi:MAG TPA: hypothetical protein VKZ63_13680 [Kofleriaceae bacterium]|nr:hypothetical protein [Kofleriaceae bacterium]
MGKAVTADDVNLEQVADITAISRGIPVRGRCVRIGDLARHRHEILLEAGLDRAIVDVPPGRDPHALLLRALELFSESLAARR